MHFPYMTMCGFQLHTYNGNALGGEQQNDDRNNAFIAGRSVVVLLVCCVPI
jgi:hypothetical protein